MEISAGTNLIWIVGGGGKEGDHHRRTDKGPAVPERRG